MCIFLISVFNKLSNFDFLSITITKKTNLQIFYLKFYINAQKHYKIALQTSSSDLGHDYDFN